MLLGVCVFQVLAKYVLIFCGFEKCILSHFYVVEGKMHYPEYLQMFSNNGKGKIHVSLRGNKGIVKDLAFSPIEVMALLREGGDEFHRYIRFDDYLFEVVKYEIDPRAQTLTITAKPKE